VTASLDAAATIAALDLRPHPEGGWFAETWRDAPADGSRGVGTAIYFLLEPDQVSHWHRVDATEIWHHYAGGPLDLLVADVDAGPVGTTRLGADLAGGERPQATVPAGAWQAARPVGGAVLVGCTVAPAFSFAGFELAPEGWSPGR
jgi:predicted cupin superfamily sugar epimerase